MARSNSVVVFFRRTLPVGIFDSQDSRARVMFRKKPVKQSGSRAAYMEVARVGWSKANSDVGIHQEFRPLLNPTVVETVGEDSRDDVYAIAR